MFPQDDMLPDGPPTPPPPAPATGPVFQKPLSATEGVEEGGGGSSPGGYMPSVGEGRRSRRASALGSGTGGVGAGTGGGKAKSMQGVSRRHSSATSGSIDFAKLSNLAKTVEERKGSSSSSEDSDEEGSKTSKKSVGMAAAAGHQAVRERSLSPRPHGQLSPGGDKGALTDAAAGSTLSTSRAAVRMANSQLTERDGVVGSLERQVEMLRAEKETLIKAHATEIAEGRASVRTSGSAARVAGEDVVRLEAQVLELREKLYKEEGERARVVNELARNELKAAEERAVAQASFNTSVDESRRRHDGEMRSLSESHASAIAQMKRLHLEELASVKERAGDASVLDSVVAQIKASAGTLKVLENQMQVSKVAMEAGRESQLEARERLIGDMERSARESMERNESQAATLGGTVNAVEGVMRSLRNVNVEERERLKGEHERLAVMQSSIGAEMVAIREGNRAEREKLADRWAAFEVEKRRMEEELSIRREEIDRDRSFLKRERGEFAKLQGEGVRASDAKIKEMAREEKRLGEARAQLMRDVAVFEQKQDGARYELVNAEQARLEIDSMRTKLEEDKEKVNKLGEELHRVGVEVHEKGVMAEKKLSEAERLKMEGLNDKRIALAAKNSVEVEKARFAEESKRQEAERVKIAHERMSLIRDQGTNRQLNMKLNSAAGVMGAGTGGFMGWAGGGGERSGREIVEERRKERREMEGRGGGGEKYDRDALLQLRKQVQELGAGERGGWAEEEDVFVRSAGRGGGKGDGGGLLDDP